MSKCQVKKPLRQDENTIVETIKAQIDNDVVENKGAINEFTDEVKEAIIKDVEATTITLPPALCTRASKRQIIKDISNEYSSKKPKFGEPKFGGGNKIRGLAHIIAIGSMIAVTYIGTLTYTSNVFTAIFEKIIDVLGLTKTYTSLIEAVGRSLDGCNSVQGAVGRVSAQKSASALIDTAGNVVTIPDNLKGFVDFSTMTCLDAHKIIHECTEAINTMAVTWKNGVFGGTSALSSLAIVTNGKAMYLGYVQWIENILDAVHLLMPNNSIMHILLVTKGLITKIPIPDKENNPITETLPDHDSVALDQTKITADQKKITEYFDKIISDESSKIKGGKKSRRKTRRKSKRKQIRRNRRKTAGRKK